MLERRQESADCLSVLFERPKGFAYRAGGWMDIRFLDPDLAVGRTYSFASSPTERDLRITFKRGRSAFKRKLEALEAGDVALITQYGVNELVLDKGCPAVCIAGGVGIAPFRSMIKEAVDFGDAVEIALVHVARSDEDFAFRDEIAGWRRERPTLRAKYVATEREGRLNARRLAPLVAEPSASDALFYLAGPPAMVESTARMLDELGVASTRIRSDPFEGY